MNCGTTPGLGVDSKVAIQHFQPFFHAGKADPSAMLSGFAVETCACVPNREMNRVRRSPQLHIEVACAAVFC